ncbi:hypothetical protein M1394_00865 [Candidatus Marsarchaeota archaeon]|nr:hypothetical protein [Candidatus Marsarchaeota archaeon]
MTAYTASAIQGSSSLLVIAFVAIILTFRVYRNMKGTKFTAKKLYIAPATYILLALFSFAIYSYTVDEIVLMFVLMAAGVGAGYVLGSAEFFINGGETFYKRSPVIITIWLISYIARFGLAYAYPNVIIINIIVEAALFFTTGLITGEAVSISRKYEEHKRNSSVQTTSQ